MIFSCKHKGKTPFNIFLTTVTCLLLATMALGVGGCGCGTGGKGGTGGEARGGAAKDQTGVKGMQVPSADPFSEGWFGIIATRLPVFTEQLVPSSEGWALLYKGDFQEAAQAFTEQLDFASHRDGPEGAGDPKVAQLRTGLGRAEYETGIIYREGHKFGLSLQREYFNGLTSPTAATGDNKNTPAADQDTSKDAHDWKTRLAWEAADLTAFLEPDCQRRVTGEYEADPAVLLKLAAEAKGAGDSSLEGLTMAMAGLAAQVSGDHQAALKHFKKARTTGTTGALAAAYWNTRLGLTSPADQPPLPDPASLSLPMDLRLYFGNMVWADKLEEAETITHRICNIQSSDFVKEQTEGSGDPAQDNKGIEYYLPWTMGDLARYHFLLAANALEPHTGAKADPAANDGDLCGSFWGGLINNQLGNHQEASQLFHRFLTGLQSKKEMEPVNELACSAFSPWRNLKDMEAIARQFVTIQDKGTAPDSKYLQETSLDVWQTALLANVKKNELGSIPVKPGSGSTGTPRSTSPAFKLEELEQMGEAAAHLSGLMDTWLNSDTPSQDGAGAVRELRLSSQLAAYYVYELACLAQSLDECPLALRMLETAHDNSNIDKLSSINRPLIMLGAARINWTLKRNRRAIRLMQTLEESYPLVWQLSEMMKRIELFDAIGDRSAPVVGN